MYSYARPNIASTKDASDRQQFWGREAPRDPGYDGVSGRPCSLAEMAIPDAVVRRHATNKVVVFSLHFCLTVIFAVLVLHYCPTVIFLVLLVVCTSTSIAYLQLSDGVFVSLCGSTADASLITDIKESSFK